MKTALEFFASRFLPLVDSARGAIAMPPPTGSSGAFAAMSLACGTPGNGRRCRIVAAITPGMPDAERLADDLDALAPFSGCKVLEFPPPIEGDKAALGCRLKTLSAISEWKMAPESLVISLPCAAVAGRIPAADSVGKTRFAAGSISFSGAKECLSRLGYTRVAAVSAQGEWASRGGIVDFWAPVEDFPVRAEFFGEDLESLRSFDPATQLSTGALVSADASAATERDGDGSTFFDMLPEDAIVLAIGYGSYEFDPGGRFTVYAGGAAPQGTETIGFETSPLPGFAELGAAEARHPELFDAARKRLEAHLRSARARGCIVAEAKDLSGGFEMPGLAVVSKADRVFTKRRPRRDKRTGGGARLGDFADLEPGEYVVHANHGVGRYIGSSEITVDGRRTEAYTIEYAEGAKLLVPAAHAHLLTKYVGVAGAEVELHRLDGKKWSKDKSAAEKAVHDLASALLETQARRATVPGFAYDVKCEGVEAFEAAFPYVETEDQMKAIDDVKRDLASTRPMDRLVCGDAGYGKTEVAIRAAYIAAMNGKQTVVLAPTTVLAEQHFETFVSRFDGTPVRVEAISRLQTKGARNGTLERIASGACDIVVGTHAILSGKVRFKDLGLVVIDEEQRFGVRHKEFLKRLKATADVLTLSATPIPRTLYMSMTGTRDLSILRTPPSERVAVETIVTRESDELVKASIERELARGGQVFYLHNRISTIWDVEKRLSKLCPGVKIAVAHGRMDAAELAGRMRAFQRGECDILLSTTIVESGIDIPTANTIIVDRADTFGLADLYQLRGRVGRSSKQGRAVLLLPPHGLVDAEARERMDALRRHGGLGAGFDLAVRDLELRGSGNLLGTQQSGHIAAIGFVLYCKLLKRTIAALKGEKPKETAVVTLNLDFAGPFYSKEDDPSSARIPYEYVEDDSARMDILRRIAEAETKKDVSVLSKELSDRFGKPPPAAKRLLSLAVLKTACAAAGISRVDAKDGKAVFRDAATGNIKAVAELRKSSSDKMIAELTRFAERLSDGDAQKAK